VAPLLQHLLRSNVGEAAWRRFVFVVLTVFGGGIVFIYVALLVLDPYDTGRFPTFMPPGIPDEHAQINIASRGRNPSFNAAVFGNSHGQLLNPSTLSAATGMKFMQMTSPGTGPREHMSFIRYFYRHHADMKAAVLAIDERWCTHDPALPSLYEFSPWLYEGNFQYLKHLLSTRAIALARKRVMMALGRIAAHNPAGFLDYETGRPWTFRVTDNQPPRGIANSDAVNRFFPALDAFDKLLAELPAALPIVIVMPPQSSVMLPQSGTAAANELAACKKAIAQRVAGRPRSAYFDYLVDGPIARDPANFMDFDHYRLHIARQIEARIARILNGQIVSPQEAALSSGK
jgi:hypothetical protein